MPHPPAGIFHVAGPSWDEMDVAVEYRLPRRLPDVHPNVESLDGIIFLPDGVFRPSEEIVACLHLGGPEIEQLGEE